jgi:hypothetical protein
VEDDLQFAPEILDKMTGMEFLSLMKEFCGVRRSTELIGWLLLLGVAGIENGPKVRHSLEEAGYNDTSMYRAMADLRRFGEFIEKRYHRRMGLVEMVHRVAAAPKKEQPA